MIKFTQKIIDKMTHVQSMHCPTDEDLFWHLTIQGVINYSLAKFKLDLAEHRKIKLYRTTPYKEDEEDIKLKYEFYELVDTFKATGLSPVRLVAYSGAMKDPKLAIDYLKLNTRENPIKIELESSFVEMSRDERESKINLLLEKLNRRQ